MCHESEWKYARNSLLLLVLKDNKRSTLVSHVRTEHEEKIVCEKCPKILKPISMDNHVKTQHEGIRKCHKCEICLITFVKTKDFVNHVRKCGLERTDCELCGKELYDAASLKKHIKSRHENLPYQCDTCEERFNQERELKAHIEYAHVEGDDKCHICAKSFSSKANLKRHNAAVHNKEPKAKTAKNHNELKWDICQKDFENTNLLAEHTKAFHNFKCSLCEMRFKEKDLVKRHRVAYHKTTVTYLKCKTCTASFTQRHKYVFHCFYQHKCKCCKNTYQYIEHHLGKQSIKLKKEIARQVQMLEELKQKQMNLENELKTKQNEVITLKDENKKIKEKLVNVTDENKKLKDENEKYELTIKSFDTLENQPIETKGSKNPKPKKKIIDFVVLEQNTCKFCREPFPSHDTYMVHMNEFHFCQKCKKYNKGHICGRY